jgi:molybdopterin-guanine dinucleotide biosynthesis protein A/molybdopterin converting factor small subunit
MENNQTITDATAIILTGGKSSRMGRPKALLLFDNEPLIVHILRALKCMFADAVVVAAPGQELPPLPATVARDEVPYQGPVGGIYYGLKAAGGEFCFVTSCDAPFLNVALVSHLLSEISSCDVVVPYWQERFQPLHAVYRKSVLPLLKDQLDRGELRPVFLYDKVRTHKIGEEEIRRFDPEGLSFLNMNTPTDYALALKRWQEVRQRTETETASSPVSVTVELFGVPRLLAKTKAVSLSLPQEATLSQVFSALAERLPILVGRVISSDGGNLFSGYACNVNGLEFVRSPSAKVNPGDRIFILSADAGG